MAVSFKVKTVRPKNYSTQVRESRLDTQLCFEHCCVPKCLWSWPQYIISVLRPLFSFISTSVKMDQVFKGLKIITKLVAAYLNKNTSGIITHIIKLSAFSNLCKVKQHFCRDSFIILYFQWCHIILALTACLFDGT